jgi:tRNA(Arg) A34 adenosine deaminase TadA
MIRTAEQAAIKTGGIRNFFMGACIYNNGKYVAAGNTWKTHPLMMRYSNFPHMHAEIHAAVRIGLDNLAGATLVVSRIKVDGNRGPSCPCKNCAHFLINHRFKNVYYYEPRTNAYVKWRVNDTVSIYQR